MIPLFCEDGNCCCDPGPDHPLDCPPHGPPPGHPGPGFPERGWIQFLILRLLYERPMHGYQLMEELEKRDFVLEDRLKPGAIYTILRRMEARGMVESEWERTDTGPDRRIYRVAESGKRALRHGLEIMIWRKALLDDLSAFYDEHFAKDAGEPNGHAPEDDEKLKGGE
jgi:PadR family transcriptional regulator PadR